MYKYISKVHIPVDQLYGLGTRSYQKCFIKGENVSGSMEVFSLPLLAHLAMNLISVSQQPVRDLLQNSTYLYRNLVDEVVWWRGRLGEGSDAVVDQTGADLELRGRLQRTAVAITVFGTENIPSRELAIRLGLKVKELENWAQNSTKNHYLTELMINFFFKGGNEKLGCEFLHKSFREYLFAEYIVESMKQFGRDQGKVWPEQPNHEYWKDFPEKSNLWQLSRHLAESLSAQWMNQEVATHLGALIRWEVDRADSPSNSDSRSTQPLSLERWEYVRDALADLWDWWGEGVHLRRPVSEDERGPVFGSAYVDDLVKNVAPRDPQEQQPGMPTVRATTLDAHLGDSLFRLNVLVHFRIAARRGWTDFSLQLPASQLAAKFWEESSQAAVRRYQTAVSKEAKTFILFAPSGPDPQYFETYAHRINAAGWRAPFPSGIYLVGLDLHNTVVRVGRAPIEFSCCNLSSLELTAGIIVARTSLARGLSVSTIGHYWGSLVLEGCDLEGARLGEAFNPEFPSVIHECNLRDVSFEFADLRRAVFRNSPTQNSQFRRAHIADADFDDASRPH